MRIPLFAACLAAASSCSSSKAPPPPTKYKVIAAEKTAAGEKAMTVGQKIGSYHSRSKVFQKFTGRELQKRFAQAKAENDLLTLSVLIEESFNAQRDDLEIVPILGALLADERKAVLADDDPVTRFLAYKVGNDIKTEDLTLSIYAAWHLQSRLKTTPENISIHSDRVYYARQGNFAVGSEPLLAAWRKWWKEKRQDFEDAPAK
ncbi:MAG: hypothetical protein RL095_1693 [Verrucomicrobiota bacterium]|jgi:hypothetical protein